jgi:hypothetical protein
MIGTTLLHIRKAISMSRKDLYSFAVVCLMATRLMAQAPYDIPHKYDRLAELTVITSDSAFVRINSKLDSLQMMSINLLNPDLYLSNLKQRLTEKKLNPADSIKALKELDSIKGDLQHRIDSLSSLHLPTDRYKQKLDSVKQLNPTMYQFQSNLNHPIDQLEDKINKPVNDFESKVNEKLVLMSADGGGAATIPNINISDLNTGDLKISVVSDVSPLGAVDKALTDIETPLANQVQQVENLKDKATDLRKFPEQQIDKLKSINEIQRVEGKVGEANELVDKAQAYQQDAAAIATGELDELKAIPDAIEDRVASLDEVQELQKQTGEMTKYQDLITSGNDPTAIKAQAKKLVAKYAIDHFASQHETLKGAIDRIGKLKSKFSQVSSIKDLPKRAPNPMKSKPFIERLLPGFAFQIQKTSTLMIDLNPTIAFRFTGRFTSGAGWNERLSFTEWNKVVLQDRIFGPRVFSSYSFRKAFSVKAEVEKMNVYLPAFVPNAEGNRAWVWSVFVGFKKDYSFYKKIKGSVQVLYNLYDDHDSSPYMNRLNVRMGFEFPFKKKQKPTG